MKLGNQLYNDIFERSNLISLGKMEAKVFQSIAFQGRISIEWISCLASSNPIDLLMDVSVEILEKPSVGEYELVAAPISIEGD